MLELKSNEIETDLKIYVNGSPNIRLISQEQLESFATILGLEISELLNRRGKENDNGKTN